VSKQKHDRGNIKRKHAEQLREKAEDRDLNPNRMASSLVKRGLASPYILTGVSASGQARFRSHD
jgi:hypothetical protein